MQEALGKEDKARLVQVLKDYFREERDEEIGELAAGILLDLIEKEMGPIFFNQGVRAARAKTVTAFADLTEQMDYLEQMVPKGRSASPGRGKPAKGREAPPEA